MVDSPTSTANNVSHDLSPARHVEASESAPNQSAINPIKNFEYAIKGKKGNLASLTLVADRALSRNMPNYLKGCPIKGRVYLRADKLQGVHLVTITIEGNIMYGSAPGSINSAVQQTFMKVRKVVWSSMAGFSPENTNVFCQELHSGTSRHSDLGCPEGISKHRPDNISVSEGRSWDFSFYIPDQVAVRYGKEKQVALFSPPETFSERLARASVAYQITVKYSRGKWLAPYKIPVPFGYVPVTKSNPFSPLRRLSYQDNLPLLGPTVDVDGWHSLKQVSVKGTLFNERQVEINCTLFLAKPLSYTRGSLIPFFLLLEGEDAQATHLLSTPSCIDICLQRRIRYHYDTIHTLGASFLEDSVDVLSHAVLWPSNDVGRNDSHTSWLNGEIYISPSVKPSCTMGDFRMEYNVLVSFDGPEFKPMTKKPLITHPIDIVTLFAPGPRPRRYGPLSYERPAPILKTLFYY